MIQITDMYERTQQRRPIAMFVLVMCELNSPAALAPIRETVEVFGPACHFYDSFFLVSTDQSPEALKRALHRLVDGQAILYVFQLQQEYIKYLPRETLDWVATHGGRGEQSS